MNSYSFDINTLSIQLPRCCPALLLYEGFSSLAFAKLSFLNVNPFEVVSRYRIYCDWDQDRTASATLATEL